MANLYLVVGDCDGTGANWDMFVFAETVASAIELWQRNWECHDDDRGVGEGLSPDKVFEVPLVALMANPAERVLGWHDDVPCAWECP